MSAIAISLLWVAPFALLVGLSLGGLGGGGAILTVPILVYLLGQSPNAATTGSLVIVGLTALAGVAGHWRAGNVHLKDGLVFGAAGILGSLVGSRLSVLVPPDLLMSAFAVLMLAVAVVMLRRRSRKPAAKADGRRRGLGVLLATATGVGLLTGFFGVGGGFAAVPALVLALGFSMPAAVGTSLVVIVINSGTALLGRISGGIEIDWPVIIVFSVVGALGSVLGSRLARRLKPRHLSLAFSVLMVGVACYMLVMNVPAVLA